ncbi:Hypothetical predicted protein [Olea europaea subsp. europaea]|uniref:Uncharacterized protein n=1 Tax=Olea europaea subsp. europaea TaxID=158383 RepID=A0A8S0U6P2_OLEEU|nr:Hypothetical predicted protein [Olea europaea subsp. europaea]
MNLRLKNPSPRTVLPSTPANPSSPMPKLHHRLTKAANSELSSPIPGTGLNNYSRAPPPLHSIHHGEQDAHMRPHQFISNQPIGLHTPQAGGSISSNRGQILSKLTIGSSRPKNIRMHLQFDRK